MGNFKYGYITGNMHMYVCTLYNGAFFYFTCALPAARRMASPEGLKRRDFIWWLKDRKTLA